MPSDDRDQQFERALKRHLHDASPESACPDAETLAAYHERTLSLEEMSRWKDHVTGCARCLESLALVEQSENMHREEWVEQELSALMDQKTLQMGSLAAEVGVPLAEAASPTPTATALTPTPTVKSASRPHWRWIIPLGTLAASVIVWIGVKEIRTQHRQSIASVQVAQNQTPQPSPPSPGDQVSDQLRIEQSLKKNSDELALSRKALQTPSGKITAPQGTGSSTHPNALPAPAYEDATSLQKETEATNAARVAMPKLAPTAPRDAAGTRSKQMAAPSAASAAAPAETGSGAQGPVIAEGQTEKRKSQQVPSVTQTVTVQSQAAVVDKTVAANAAGSSSTTEPSLDARNFTELLALSAEDRHYIVAPGEKHAWRVGDAGKIERSTDRGKTWKLQKSGETADLTAGSATSDQVCWVVGKAGTILLTTDGGKHWKPISSPFPEDLGGIHAIDTQHASIWDVPNRRSYETSDGGTTWKRSSDK
jgi:hypothetical protein